MITDIEEAQEILERLKKSIEFDPEKFWKEFGWDLQVVERIAYAGSMAGLGDPERIMATLQMGAVLATYKKQMARNAPDHLIPVSRP